MTKAGLTIMTWHVAAAAEKACAAAFDDKTWTPFWVRFNSGQADGTGAFAVVRYDASSPDGRPALVHACQIIGRVTDTDLEHARKSDWSLGFHPDHSWYWCLYCGSAAAKARFEDIQAWLRAGGILCPRCGHTSVGITSIPDTQYPTHTTAP